MKMAIPIWRLNLSKITSQIISRIKIYIRQKTAIIHVFKVADYEFAFTIENFTMANFIWQHGFKIVDPVLKIAENSRGVYEAFGRFW